MSSTSRWTLKCSFTLKLVLQVVGKCPYVPPGGFWKHLYWLLSSCTPQRLTSWSNCKEGEDSQGLKDWNMAPVCYKRLVLRKKKRICNICFQRTERKTSAQFNKYSIWLTLFHTWPHVKNIEMTLCEEHYLHFVFKKGTWNHLYPIAYFFLF